MHSWLSPEISTLYAVLMQMLMIKLNCSSSTFYGKCHVQNHLLPFTVVKAFICPYSTQKVNIFPYKLFARVHRYYAHLLCPGILGDGTVVILFPHNALYFDKGYLTQGLSGWCSWWCKLLFFQQTKVTPQFKQLNLKNPNPSICRLAFAACLIPLSVLPVLKTRGKSDL